MAVLKLFKKYKPHEKQVEFHKSDARFKNLCAGVRSGKTYAAAREFIKKIRKDAKTKNKKNFLYWAVAPNHVIGQTQREEVFKVLTEPYGLNFEDVRKSPLVRYWNENQKLLGLVFTVDYKGRKVKKYIRIKFKSAEKPESLVSDTVDGTWIDEAARLKPAAWPNIRARGTTTKGWVIFSTTPYGRNWYYEQVYLMGDPMSEKYDENFENFVFYTTDNTSVPGIQVEVELARKSMPEKYFKRDFMASFDTFTGQIYEDFNRKTHLIKRQQIKEMIEVKRFKTYIMGKDWGYTNAGVSLVLAIDDDLNFFVIDCVYKKGVEVVAEDKDDWIKIDKELLKKYPIEMIFADPARPEHFKSYRKSGVSIKEADNTVLAGIQRVATLLHVNPETKLPKLFIAEDLKEVVNEIEAYKWKESRDGDLKEEPEKVNDHTMDALRYAIYTYMLKYSNLPAVRTMSRNTNKKSRGW